MGTYNRYYDEFKQNLVNLHNSGRTQAQLTKEYGVSYLILSKWIRQLSKVKLYDNQVLTAQQAKKLQTRNTMLEEENLILKKPLPYSSPSNRP